MAQKARETSYAPKPSKAKPFDEMMKSIPDYLFDRMVARAGMTSTEARDLCTAFRELKK